jgi:uncharacterized protein
MCMKIPSNVWQALEDHTKFNLQTGLTYSCLVGSTSHNTYVPKSDDDHSIDDIDIFMVAVAPPKMTYGLMPWKESCQVQIDEWDIVIYGLRKYTQLLLKGNPNCIGTLWVRPEEHLEINPVFADTYLKERDIFSCKEHFHSFAGYANAQLKDMVNSENMYRGYMGERRKRLVDKYGFDCKNASHLIRLTSMCKEYMETGIMNVYRTHDAQLLRDIKSGKYKLEEIQQMANDLFAESRQAYEKSPLPPIPNVKRAEEILMEVTKYMWDYIYSEISITS